MAVDVSVAITAAVGNDTETIGVGVCIRGRIGAGAGTVT